MSYHGNSQDWWEKTFLKDRNFVYATIIIMFCLLIGLFLWSSYSEDYLPQPIVKKIKISAEIAKNSILGLFYSTFGYPADPRMTTADELFRVINSYRVQAGLTVLNKKDFLCEDAEASLKSLSSVIYTKKYEMIRDFRDDRERVFLGKELTQVFEQPVLAENVLARFWLQPFSQQKKIVDDSVWRYGCGAVSNLQLVFIFSQ